MMYSVRWTPQGGSEEYRSRNHATADDAVGFACTILAQMVVHEIRVVDLGGQQVMMMPEIMRYCRGKNSC